MLRDSARRQVTIGLMGMGVVGGGVARVLLEKADSLARYVGCPLLLKKVLIRDISRAREVAVDRALLTSTASDIIDDPEIDIVVEVMGGEKPAADYISESLSRGKYVVTANKEVIAKHGYELLRLAARHRTNIMFEASVGGGIPLIGPFQDDLAANHISSVHAIINGTTNYILTRMANEGSEFADALKEAQKLGYAEADPRNDIEGVDAKYKLAILATIAFHNNIRPDAIYNEGISKLNARDFRYARELGYGIKLLAIAKQKDDVVEVRVHPVLIPQDFLLAKVDGVFNAVQVDGDLVGKVIFYGRGAGSLPTASSIMANVLCAASQIHQGRGNTPPLFFEPKKKVRSMNDIVTRYYIRMSTEDRPGVLARISRILGDNRISISSVIQKETDPAAQTAEIVIMTHPAIERSLQRALARLRALPAVREIGNVIRIED